LTGWCGDVGVSRRSEGRLEWRLTSDLEVEVVGVDILFEEDFGNLEQGEDGKKSFGQQ